jgi:hypothetical protein
MECHMQSRYAFNTTGGKLDFTAQLQAPQSHSAEAQQHYN